MWHFTPHGFVSIVQKPSDVEDDTLTVRSRDVRSLQHFAVNAGIHDTGWQPEVNMASDYPFRIVATRQQCERFLLSTLGDVRYSNFKNAAKAERGKIYAGALSTVWGAMLRLTPTKVKREADRQWDSRYPAPAPSSLEFNVSRSKAPATSSQLNDRREYLDEHEDEGAWNMMDTYLSGIEEETRLEEHSMSVGDLTANEWDTFVAYFERVQKESEK